MVPSRLRVFLRCLPPSRLLVGNDAGRDLLKVYADFGHLTSGFVGENRPAGFVFQSHT
jgi:hypothetical protein